MNPHVMGTLLVVGFAGFIYSIYRRFNLLRVGGPTSESPSYRIAARFARVWRRVVLHEKLHRYRASGLAHQLVFVGFMVLTVRTITLWGRGFDGEFQFWFLAPNSAAGHAYDWLKDISVLATLAGVGVFTFFRLVRPQRRMTLSIEGVAILGGIALMMLADTLYVGAGTALRNAFAASRPDTLGGAASVMVAPFVTLAREGANSPPPSAWIAILFERASVAELVVLGHVGFWVHCASPLVLLNWLPYSKHFHVITAVPNVFLSSQESRARLGDLANDAESLVSLVEGATGLGDELRAPIGAARIHHYSWKDNLDFYSCTECGRCAEHCPATRAGKSLNPKNLVLSLRDHLYQQQARALSLRQERRAAERLLRSPSRQPIASSNEPVSEDGTGTGPAESPGNLVPGVVSPEAIWACTTCRACEEECPVEISHVQKIVAMRRNLVLVRGEHFPAELQRMFDGIETNGNPWNLPREDRGKWSEGLGVKTMAAHPSTPLLYWVGCSASYDERARSIARATARLLQLAKVDFAILGVEEGCTGDPARRAGNEFLFLNTAERNVTTFERYRRQGGIQRIVTGCPHCYSVLANDYRALGGNYEVIHHSQMLVELLEEGRLQPRRPASVPTVIQDACYLGRYHGLYDAPREILRRAGDQPALEVPSKSRSRGGCCGAGGSRMWMDEPAPERVNVARTRDLMSTGARRVATSCPFCMAMIADGLRATDLDPRATLDVAELLWQACQ